MRVRQQHRQIQRLILEFRQQRTAQRPQPRAGVEEDDFSAGAHFDARRIAAIAHGCRSRRRNRAAHAPEFHISGSFDAKNLTRVWQKTNCKNNRITAGHCPGAPNSDSARFAGNRLSVPIRRSALQFPRCRNGAVSDAPATICAAKSLAWRCGCFNMIIFGPLVGW